MEDDLTFTAYHAVPKDSIMFNYLTALVRNTRGATAIEYGLIAALIAVAAIAAMQGIGNSLNKTFNNVSAKMKAG